jgi:hypothetical protein
MHVPTNAEHLSPDHSFQQLLYARDDIPARDSEINRLQTTTEQRDAELKRLIETSIELIASRISTYEQQLDLLVNNGRIDDSRLKDCEAPTLVGFHWWMSTALSRPAARCSNTEFALSEFPTRYGTAQARILELEADLPSLRPKKRAAESLRQSARTSDLAVAFAVSSAPT